MVHYHQKSPTLARFWLLGAEPRSSCLGQNGKIGEEIEHLQSSFFECFNCIDNRSSCEGYMFWRAKDKSQLYHNQTGFKKVWCWKTDDSCGFRWPEYVVFDFQTHKTLSGTRIEMEKYLAEGGTWIKRSLYALKQKLLKVLSKFMWMILHKNWE